MMDPTSLAGNISGSGVITVKTVAGFAFSLRTGIVSNITHAAAPYIISLTRQVISAATWVVFTQRADGTGGKTMRQTITAPANNEITLEFFDAADAAADCLFQFFIIEIPPTL